jgi:hypothetical protein
MDQQVIRETISVTSTNVTDEDKALGAEFNKTMWRALAQANLYLSHGPESARLTITKSFLTAASRLSALDSQSEIEEHRLAFMSYLSHQQTDIHAAGGDPPAPHAIDATSANGRADDQDD